MVLLVPEVCHRVGGSGKCPERAIHKAEMAVYMGEHSHIVICKSQLLCIEVLLQPFWMHRFRDYRCSSLHGPFDEHLRLAHAFLGGNVLYYRMFEKARFIRSLQSRAAIIRPQWGIGCEVNAFLLAEIQHLVLRQQWM